MVTIGGFVATTGRVAATVGSRVLAETVEGFTVAYVGLNMSVWFGIKPTKKEYVLAMAVYLPPDTSGVVSTTGLPFKSIVKDEVSTKVATFSFAFKSATVAVVSNGIDKRVDERATRVCTETV